MRGENPLATRVSKSRNVTQSPSASRPTFDNLGHRGRDAGPDRPAAANLTRRITTRPNCRGPAERPAATTLWSAGPPTRRSSGP